jgi:hypothetical protein
MTALPRENSSFNWGNLWADLLKGTGRGLLEYDGSRAAQAALAGLEVFDAAQERRRQPDQHEADNNPYQDIAAKLGSVLSPEQWAALLRLGPEDQAAWTEEWMEGSSGDAPRADYSPPTAPSAQPLLTTRPPLTGQPIPINPLDGWRLQSVMPFDAHGRMNLPTYRR